MFSTALSASAEHGVTTCSFTPATHSRPPWSRRFSISTIAPRSTASSFCSPFRTRRNSTRRLLDQGIVSVRVSQRPFAGLPRISVCDQEAADEMTEHLIELGHRRIGFIMGHPDHGSSHDRLAGYTSALERHGIAYDEALVEHGLYDYESGYACARRLLDVRPRPSAIFASNDHMAMATLTAAHERRLEIPRDLSVAGFDDTSFAGFAWPPLTTVRQPVVEVARLATNLLARPPARSGGGRL